jgi:hypothetical protein
MTSSGHLWAIGYDNMERATPIRGLGETVLMTNVDPERARLIQSTLAAASPPAS